MKPSELVDQVLRDPGSAPRALASHAGTPGVSAEYFGRVLKLFATDHAALQRLVPESLLVVRYGDNRALSYRALAIVYRAAGKWMASANAFRRSGLAAQNDRDRFAFQTGAIDSLARGGQTSKAIALGREIIGELERLGENGLAARAALNVGYAYMQQDRYREAWKALEGVEERLSRSGYLTDAASARLALSTSLLFGGDVSRAREEALAAVTEANSLGLDQLAEIAKGNVAYADLLRGDADLALAQLLEIREKQREVPIEYARTLEYLGDVYGAMNLWTESADAYREALGVTRAIQPLHRAHLRLGLGRSLLASGQVVEGRSELERARRCYRRLGNTAWRAAAETALANTSLRAAKAVDSAREARSPRHLLDALLVAAELGGDLEEATRLQRRVGGSGLAWRIWAERARRSDGAARLRFFRRMFEAILADQAKTASFASRGAILRDKGTALAEYLRELLDTPTSRHVEEALSVISRSRSVTLLDELLQVRNRDSDVVRQRLLALRGELNASAADSGSGGSRRGSAQVDLDRLQRKWIEGTHAMVSSLSLPQPAQRDDATVCVQLPDGFRAISEGVVRRWDVLPERLDERLRWLNYDLLAPMLDRNTTDSAAFRGLESLGSDILPFISNATGACLDGALWRIPWIGCLDAIGESRPFEILLHPSFRGDVTGISTHTPMLWVANHANLPWASREADCFLEIFPDARVCRYAEEVRETLRESQVSILHVISHARHRARNPMLSSLDFSDASILAAEIARSDLRVELVTLSGCDTGRISDANRMEPDGLARAFLACGARHVVGSAWPLDDEAAVRLYGHFYQSITHGASLHESLRRGRQAVRQWQSHPYFWASPLVYGGYRP